MEEDRKKPVRLVKRLERALEKAARVAMGLSFAEEKRVRQNVELWLQARESEDQDDGD